SLLLSKAESDDSGGGGTGRERRTERRREEGERFVDSISTSPVRALSPFNQDDFSQDVISESSMMVLVAETQVTDSFRPRWPAQPEARLITADLTAVPRTPGV
ncbi:hypothetical protein K0M31_012389, partial [Melipona bicolor]